MPNSTLMKLCACWWHVYVKFLYYFVLVLKDIYCILYCVEHEPQSTHLVGQKIWETFLVVTLFR